MALVQQSFELVVAISDTGGNITTRTYSLVATTYAAATTAAGEIIAALNAVTTGTIRGYRLAEVFIEDAFTFPVAAQIENCAEISAPIVGAPNETAVLTIPAPDPGIFVASTGPSSNVVDISDTAVAAYLELFSNTGVATISDGELINPTGAVGKRIHKKSRLG